MRGTRHSLAFVRKVRRFWSDGHNTRQIAWTLNLPESVIYNARAQGDGSYTPTSTPFPSEVLAEVSHVFGVGVGEIKTGPRTNRIVEARWSAIHIARHLRKSSYSILGQMLGMDHTSVIYAVKGTDALLERDDKSEFQEKYWAARNSLKTGAL